jgi:tight adherence protein B
MRARLSLTLLAIAAACAATSLSAGAATIRVTPTSTQYPARTYVVSLPSGQRIEPSSVDVSENGHGVVDLNVAPAGGRPSATVLVIDSSDSMAGKPIRGAFDAARAFASRRNVNQKIGVVTFDASTKTLTLPTRDQDKINKALSTVPQTSYGTHLFDAVSQAMTLLRASGAKIGSIVVLTDGGDTGSKISLETMAATARDSNIPVYTVGLKDKRFDPTTLEKLATETGGSFSSATSSDQLRSIYDQLGLELSHEYLVSYNSTERPGKKVNVVITVPGIGTAKQHYQAPELTIPTVTKTTPSSFWTSGWTMLLIALLIPALLGGAWYIAAHKSGSTVRTRLADYVSIPTARSEADALVNRVFSGTERSLERMRWWARYKQTVQFSDIGLTPTQLVFATVLLTGLAMWLLSFIATILIPVGLLVPFIARGFVRSRIARKQRRFGDQLPDNLDVLASGLRAGHSLVGALAVVANDAPEPSRTEFQRVIADEQLGVSLEEALGNVAKRMDSRDMEQVVLVASVQGEAGGNVAEVLDRVTESIRERQEVRRLVRVLTAQGRLARWIVSALPVGLLIMISITSGDYMKPLFHHTSGQIVLVFAALMVIAGSFVIGKIVDIQV